MKKHKKREPLSEESRSTIATFLTFGVLFALVIGLGVLFRG